ncbi:MAG: carbohydrate-binding domain-containing protein [Eubacterium sp.]|nr:carbohydrate-binding domain-containing protein [Eubacterium sp.]
MKLKKVLAIVLSASLIFAGTANIVLANDGQEGEGGDVATTYELKVNGEQFSQDKTTIQCGEGTAEYNHEASTLTLNNAQITEIMGYSGGCISSQIDGLKIVLVGDNTISNSYNSGITSTNDVTITGDGTLTITGYIGIETGTYGSQKGVLTIKDTKVILNTDDKCVSANSDVVVENSVFEAKVKHGTYSYATAISMGSIGKFIVTNSDVVVESPENSAIYMGDVFSETERKFIVDSGKVIVKSLGGSSSAIHFGPIENASIEINGGMLDVESASTVTNLEESAITIKNTSIASGAWNEKNIKITHLEHEFGSEWVYDKDSHWHECECGQKQNLEAHTGGTASEEEQAVCEVCNAPYGEKVTKPVETTEASTTEAPTTGEPTQIETTTIKSNETTTTKLPTKVIKVGKVKCKAATKKYKAAKVKISFKKVKKAKKYQVQISKSKKFNKVLVKKTVKKVKSVITSKKLKNKRKLFVRVRALQIINRKVYIGEWSKIKKVKIK